MTVEPSGEQARDFEVALWINRDIGGVPLHLSGQVVENKKDGKN